MPSALASELIPPGPATSEASTAMYVTIGQGDLLRLQDLATVAGVGEPGSRGFAELLSSALHRGIIGSYTSAGLDSPPDRARADAGSAAREDKPAGSGSSRRTGAPSWRQLALMAAAVATIIVIFGSYAHHWTWTGLTANGQVWDWLELLLLPVAIGTFPLWLRFAGEMSPLRRKLLGGAALAFTAFVLAGYLVPLTWTGFRGHTLWDWLTLILLPITITGAAVWPKTGRRFGSFDRTVAVALGVALIVTVVGGYADNWQWTGFPGNTLWEWVKLLLAPIAITTFFVPELIKLVAGNAAETGQ